MRTNEEMLRALERLVKIPSVCGADPTPEAPFGAEVENALDYVLGLCESMGMRTVKQGLCAWAEAGESGPLLAIVPHVDVVPAGEGWTRPPFACTVEDGRIYGRGVSDDKGPAIASIFALRDLMDRKEPMGCRVRIIFGRSEETGHWPDMEDYREHQETPVAGFTPDAAFPALAGEKGILWLSIHVPKEQCGLAALEGGDAVNMVASWCQAKLPETGDLPKNLRTEGKAAHATTPHQGVNAITRMMLKLKERRDIRSPLVDFYTKYLGDTLHGEALGCPLEDQESGKLTITAGMIRTTETEMVLSLDVRYPVTCQARQVMEPLQRALQAYPSFWVSVEKDNAPVFSGQQDLVLSTLLEAYRDVTQDPAAPVVIGGGTYARTIKHIVGYGPAFPNTDHTEHKPDEYILEKDFYQLRKIYSRALELLEQRCGQMNESKEPS